MYTSVNRENVAVAVWPNASITRAVNEENWVCVGVPVIVPLLFSVNPAGSDDPGTTVHVNGPVPEAVSTVKNGTPRCAFASCNGDAGRGHELVAQALGINPAFSVPYAPLVRAAQGGM